MATLSKSAFTLIELIVVMAIIVTLSVIGFISYNSYVRDSRNAVREAHLNDITKAVDQFIFTYGRPPQCGSGGPSTTICYFTNHTGRLNVKMSGVGDPGAAPGYCQATAQATACGAGIVTADWDKLGLKKGPEDPRGVHYVYAYNGSKYAIFATKELENGYAAIVKGPQPMEQNPASPTQNIIALPAGLGISVSGHTVANGVISTSAPSNYPANPLAILFNNYTSVVSPVGNAAVPYFW